MLIYNQIFMIYCREMIIDLPNISKNDVNVNVNIKSSTFVDVIQKLMIEYAKEFGRI